MARDPSKAQVKFARAIADRLGIALPDPATRQSLFIFIRDHRPEFDKQRLKESFERHNARVASIACESESEDLGYDFCSEYPAMEDLGLDPYTGGFADNA